MAADNVTSLLIANLALIRLGEKQLTTSLSERPAIATAYEPAIASAFVFARWSFSRTRQTLEQLPQVPLSTRYEKQYRLPTSPLFLLATEINDEPEHFVDYAVETLIDPTIVPTSEIRVLLCSIDPPLTLRYTTRVTEAMWSSAFYEIAAMYLALAVGESTGPKASIKNAILVDLVDKRAALALADAHQGPVKQAQQSNGYVNARVQRRRNFPIVDAIEGSSGGT